MKKILFALFAFMSSSAYADTISMAGYITCYSALGQPLTVMTDKDGELKLYDVFFLEDRTTHNSSFITVKIKDEWYKLPVNSCITRHFVTNK